MKQTINPYLFLRRPPRPDLGDESRDFKTVSLHRWREECVQLRVRRHRDGFSAGWRVIMPDVGELNVYPTPEKGLFKDERSACLFALGEIITQQSVALSQPATQAVRQAIAQWQQIPLF